MLKSILKWIRARWSHQSTIDELKAELNSEIARRKAERAALVNEILALTREMVQTQAAVAAASPPSPRPSVH